MRRAPWDIELVQKALTVVEVAALGGSETVRRIQAFSRAHLDEPFEPVDMNRVVQDAIAMTRPKWDEEMLRRRVRLDLKLELGAVSPVRGQPVALGEVLTNVILNAIDALEQGGTLSIATHQVGRERVVVTVSDTGVGMPEAVRRRIFEPFFTTKGQQGSGFGLSVSQSIMHRHAGTIQVESEPGRGTVFTLALPVSTLAQARAEQPSGSRDRRRARILVVDDEPQVLSILAEMLRRAGHTVTPAGGGEDAIREFLPHRFDLVLTNLGMRGMSGWQLIEQVRQRCPVVGVVIVTGWRLDEQELGRVRELRVGRCLFKPIRSSELDQAVQDALSAAPSAHMSD
jgi:CheY-like chemotaxis protein/anti-sigma regulatory factor (Ser/Thr protein kinase)